ncbi:reverse transcriptase, partial [Tanacetum coccineum]
IKTKLNNGEGTSQQRDNGGQTGQHRGSNGGAYVHLTKIEFPEFEGDEFGEVVTWDVYQTQVKKRFESVFDEPVVALKNLKQTTTVQVYQDSFEELLNKVDLNDDYAISLFTGGLKEEISYDVRMFKPNTLSDVFCLSKLQEYTPGHKCNGQLYSLEVIRDGLDVGEDEERQLTEEGVLSTYTTN